MEIPTASQRVADAVRAELARSRQSQAALGLALGRSQPYVSRRLNGRLPFTVDEVEHIAHFLGVPAATLIGSGETAGAA